MTTAFVRTIEISGYRGFARPQKLLLAVPNGEPGSGLTVLVGPNNGGKSSVLEALRFCDAGRNVVLSEGKRNIQTDRRVTIAVTYSTGETRTIRTVQEGGSETESDGAPRVDSIWHVPSRRSFDHRFASSMPTRGEYQQSRRNAPIREPSQRFAVRLERASKHRDAFDSLLKTVFDPPPKWAIETGDDENKYVQVASTTGTHSAEGAGDGFLSILLIVDAFYDAHDGELVLIDEPELSLHPYLQRRAMNLLLQQSRTRQVVIATHSPYFVDFNALTNGGTLARIATQSMNGSEIYQVEPRTVEGLRGLIEDINNPHVLGLDACEVFFLDDGIVLVEGQEDVVLYRRRVLPELGIELKGQLYGWGVGGAGKMRLVVALLQEMGFQTVVGILDGDQVSLKESLVTQFPDYRFFAIAADDVRTKIGRQIPSVRGLLDDDNRHVRPEYREGTERLLADVNAYLGRLR